MRGSLAAPMISVTVIMGIPTVAPGEPEHNKTGSLGIGEYPEAVFRIHENGQSVVDAIEAALISCSFCSKLCLAGRETTSGRSAGLGRWKWQSPQPVRNRGGWAFCSRAPALRR